MYVRFDFVEFADALIVEEKGEEGRGMPSRGRSKEKSKRGKELVLAASRKATSTSITGAQLGVQLKLSRAQKET